MPGGEVVMLPVRIGSSFPEGTVLYRYTISVAQNVICVFDMLTAQTQVTHTSNGCHLFVLF